jgi:hypothetical protein
MSKRSNQRGSNGLDNTSESIRVVVRLRPENTTDRNRFGKHCVSLATNKSLSLHRPSTLAGNMNHHINANIHNENETKAFTFDAVLGQYASQTDVFNSVSSLCDSVVNGYNATIFAYGATGSGKTHTMMGDEKNPGITPRTVERLFKLIDEFSSKNNGMMFMVRMSFVEIYNNTFRDLLEGSTLSRKARKRFVTDDERIRAKIDIRESNAKGVYLTGSPTLRSPVKNVAEVLNLINYGLQARAVGCTNLNEHSSRSHSILTLHVESREGVDGCVCMGKMHLVDLAGSERVSLSGAEGTTLRETKNINLSLAMLGNVLSALSKFHSTHSSKHNKHHPKPVIPYRDSKLTYLLKDSLGGNSKTVMLTAIRGPSAFFQQTKMSLMYASRAKKIQNSTKINVDSIGTSEMQQIATHVDELKMRLLERTTEFNRIRSLHVRSSQESAALKMRVKEMAEQNEIEKQELKRKLNEVISNKESSHYHVKHFEELTQSVEEYQETVEMQRKQISSLQKKVQGREGEAETLRKALKQTEADAQRMRSQRDAAAQRLGDESERIRQVVNEWQGQRKAMKVQIEILENELNQNREQENKINTIKDEYARSLTEIDTLKDKLFREKQLSDKKTMEKNKVVSVLSDMTTEVAQLKNELLNERKQRETMRNERKEIEQRFLQENNEKDEAFKKEIINLKNEVKKIKYAKEKVEKTMKENNGNSEIEAKVVAEKIDVLTKKLHHEEQARKQSQNRYTEQLKAFSDEISKYKKLIKNLEETNVTLNKQLRKRNEEMETNTNLFNEQLKRCSEEGDSTVATLKANEFKLKKDVEIQRNKITDLREKRDKIQSSLRTAMSTMLELQKHVQKSEQKATDSADKLLSVQNLLDEKLLQIQTKENEITSLKDELNSCKQIFEEQKSVMLHPLKERIRKFEEKELIYLNDIEEKSMSMKTLEEEIVRKEQQLADLKNDSAAKMNMYNNTMLESDNKINELKSSNKLRNDENVRLENESLQLKVTVSSLKESLQISKQNLIKYKTSNESLKSEIKEILSTNENDVIVKGKLFKQKLENVENQYKIKINELKHQLEEETLNTEKIRKAAKTKSEDLELKLINKALEIDSICSRYESEKAALIEKHKERLLDQENKYSTNMNNLSENLNTNMAEALSTAEASFNAKIEKLERKFKEEKEQNNKKNEQLLKEAQVKASANTEMLITKYENEISQRLKEQQKQLEDNFLKEIAVTKENYDLKIVKQEKEFQNTLCTMKIDNKSATEDIINDIKKEHHSAFNLLKDEYSSKIEDLNQVIIDTSKKHVGQISALEKSHNTKINALKMEHTKETNKLSEKYNMEKNDAVHNITKSLNKTFSDTKDKEIQVLKTILTKQHEKQIAELESMHNHKIQKISVELTTTEERINLLNTNLDKLKQELILKTNEHNCFIKEADAKILSLKLQHQEEIDSLSAQHVAHLKEEKELWESESKSITAEAVEKEKNALETKISSQYEENIRILQKEHNDEINDLMKKMTQIERDNFYKMNEKLDEVREKFEKDRELLQSKHEKSMLQYNENATSTFLKSQQKWQDDIVKYNEILRQKEELIKTTYDEKRVEVEQLKKEFRDDKKNILEQYQSTITNLHEENKNKLESLTLKLKEQHLSDIEEVKRNVTEISIEKQRVEILNLTNRWKMEKENFEKNADERLKELSKNHELQLQKMNEKVKATQDNYSNQIKGLQEQKKEMLSKSSCERDELIRKYEEKIQLSMDSLAISAKQNYEAEIANMLKDFETQKQEIKVQYEEKGLKQAAKLKEQLDIERDHFIEEEKKKYTIETENLVQMHIDKFNDFTTNLEIKQSEFRNSHIDRMMHRRCFVVKKMVLKDWALFVKSTKLNQFTNLSKEVHASTKLIEAKYRINSGIHVLSGWLEKGNLGKKYKAISKMRINAGRNNLNTAKMKHNEQLNLFTMYRENIVKHRVCFQIFQKRKKLFSNWRLFINHKKLGLKYLKKLANNNVKILRKLAFNKWKNNRLFQIHVQNFENEKEAFFQTYNNKLLQAKSAQQQLARENCEALANIAKEKQEEISQLIQKNQQDKEKLLLDFGEKTRGREEEYLKAASELQNHIDLLKISLKDKDTEMESIRNLEELAKSKIKETLTSEFKTIENNLKLEIGKLQGQIEILNSAKSSSEISLQTALASQMKMYDDKLTVLSNEKMEVIKKYEERIRTSMESHESEKKEEQKALMDRFKQTEEEILGTSEEKLQKQAEQFTDTITKLNATIKEYEQKLSHLSEKNSNKLEQVQQEQAGKVQLLENELKFLQTQHTKMIENIKSDYDHKIEALINEQKDIKATKDAMIDHLKANQIEKLEALQEEHQKKAKQMQINFEKEKEKAVLSASLKAIDEKASEMEDEIKQKLEIEKEKMKDDMQQMKDKFINEQKTQQETFEQNMQVEKDQMDILTFKINDLETSNKRLKEKILKIQKKTSETEQAFKSKVETQMSELKAQYDKKKKTVETNSQEYAQRLEKTLKQQKENFTRKLRESNDKNKKNKSILRKALTDQVKCYEDKLAEAQRESTKAAKAFEKQIEELKEYYELEVEQNKKILKNQFMQEQSKVAKTVLDKTITEYEKKLILVKEASSKLEEHYQNKLKTQKENFDKHLKCKIESSVQEAVNKVTVALKNEYEEKLNRNNDENEKAIKEINILNEQAIKNIENKMSPNQIGRHDPRSENTKDLKVEDIEVNVEKINEKEGKDKNTPSLNLLNTPTTSSSSPCEEKPSSSDNSMKNDKIAVVNECNITVPPVVLESRTPQAWKGISLRSSTLRVSPEDLKNQSSEIIASIHSAAYDGESDELKELLCSKQDISSISKLNGSLIPIHRAVTGLSYHGEAERVEKCMEVLLKNGFNLNDQDENGNTALMHTLTCVPAKKSITILRAMLKSESLDLSIRNENGETALHIELRRMTSMSLSIIKMIVARGCDVNGTSKNGLTPLTLCVVLARRALGSPSSPNSTTAWTGRNYWIQVARFLISRGGKWNLGNKCVVDHSERTPLHLILSMPPPALSLTKEHVSVVRHCISSINIHRFMNINAIDRYGNTALLAFCKVTAGIPQKGEGRAFYKWATSIIDSLLLQGADAKIVSRHGLSPLDMAGFWDLAPAAKKVRADGGTLYDLIWSQLALDNRRKLKEKQNKQKNHYQHGEENYNNLSNLHNVSTSSPRTDTPMHVKKIHGLLDKANSISRLTNRHLI